MHWIKLNLITSLSLKPKSYFKVTERVVARNNLRVISFAKFVKATTEDMSEENHFIESKATSHTMEASRFDRSSFVVHTKAKATMDFENFDYKMTHTCCSSVEEGGEFLRIGNMRYSKLG